MEFNIKSGSAEKQRTGCIVVGVFEKRHLSPSAVQLDKAAKGYLTDVLMHGDLDGTIGQTLLLHNIPGISADRILLVGCGAEEDLTDTRYLKAVVQSFKTLNRTGAKEAVSFLTELNLKGRNLKWKVRMAVVHSHRTGYRFDTFKSDKNPSDKTLQRLTLCVPRRKQLVTGKQALKEGNAIAEGVELARELGNLPGNVCTPSYLAERARDLGHGQRKLAVKVLEEKEMEKLGMGSLLAVARGSKEPAKLITLEYNGGLKGAKPVVLVGKGITFDSGGISLKPSATMDEMKFDMCGAASVLGTLLAVLKLQLPINLVAIIPSSENLPGGRATKPGDIVTSMSGQTIEILNTDAEGRLVLCDALTYAERYNPDTVIDIATLTGACVIALGKHATGLLSNHSSLSADLLKAGTAAVDRAWEMPLWEEYQEQLKSNFADIANVGGRQAGTITAACFLSRFTKQFHWAHLDIAGTAWRSGKAKGATGRPVPLLVQYLLDRAK
ncbi:MAG: leucyl aminopeptidase [Gammaproteobacteria bacterium]|nr:leucyl aminopeptidase [Gammaproteobacteria bacterium]